MNPQLLKPMLLLAVVLVLPIAMLAIWGEAFVGALDHWSAEPPSPPVLAALVFGILALDVFLPVPSGPVSTFAGAQLGIVVATLASSLGMTLGAAIAFGLARRWGRPLAERFSSPDQLAEADAACQRHGPWTLVMTRPLPVLAEACALLVGALQMEWRRFLPPVIVSNVAIAAVYSTLGDQAQRHGWIPAALCASAAAPLAIAAWQRRRLRTNGTAHGSNSAGDPSSGRD